MSATELKLTSLEDIWHTVILYDVTRQPAEEEASHTTSHRDSSERHVVHSQIAISPAHARRKHWTRAEREHQEADPER